VLATDIAQKVKNRYRFVFLDGCDVALGRSDILRAFGADQGEILLPEYPPEARRGGYDHNDLWYQTKGFTPGVFMGWKSEAFSKVHTRAPLAFTWALRAAPACACSRL
jgi:hypothetical protein